jgi:hypothetical protein
LSARWQLFSFCAFAKFLRLTGDTVALWPTSAMFNLFLQPCSGVSQCKNGTHIHRRKIHQEMDDDDFQIRDERDDGERDDRPASGAK